MVSPAGNSNDAAELSQPQREMINLKIGEGFYKIDPKQFSFAPEKDENYLLSLGNGGRIRVLLSLRKKLEGTGIRYYWRIDSPSLGNYFQEIKTIWKPYFIAENVVTNERSKLMIVDDVLGNILFKTPMAGSFYLEGQTPWRLSFGIQGYFDQSSMEEPLIEQRTWSLDKSAEVMPCVVRAR
jgi:hypothetical protein